MGKTRELLGFCPFFWLALGIMAHFIMSCPKLEAPLGIVKHFVILCPISRFDLGIAKYLALSCPMFKISLGKIISTLAYMPKHVLHYTKKEPTFRFLLACLARFVFLHRLALRSPTVGPAVLGSFGLKIPIHKKCTYF